MRSLKPPPPVWGAAGLGSTLLWASPRSFLLLPLSPWPRPLMVKSSPKGHTVIPASPLLTPVSCEAPLHPLSESLRGNVLYPWVACQDARAGGTWAGQLRGKLPPQSGCQSEGCCRDRGPRGPTMMGPLGASGCEFQLHRNSLRVHDSSAVTAGD